jgi:hypothetical protein
MASLLEGLRIGEILDHSCRIQVNQPWTNATIYCVRTANTVSSVHLLLSCSEYCASQRGIALSIVLLRPLAVSLRLL